ncbi:MAG: hypothetical protein EXR79_16390 [Myxococcales bacterium]|nr:hypothetical protein [Myxococcales bacterium]
MTKESVAAADAAGAWLPGQPVPTATSLPPRALPALAIPHGIPAASIAPDAGWRSAPATVSSPRRAGT